MGRPKKEKPNKQGLYEVKVTIGKNFDGTLIRKSFYSTVSKAAAKAKAEEYKINQAVAEQTGTSFITKEECFDTWAYKWLETYKLGKVKEHTYEFTYKKNVEKYLIPFFKHTKLKNIKQIDIQKYFNTVKNPENNLPLSNSVLGKHKMILKSIFDSAIDNDLCYKNPVKNINFLNVSVKKQRPVYTAQEVSKLKDYAMQNKRYDIIFLLSTGIRRSELIGLMWDDIDLASKTIHIQRAVTQTTGKIIIGEPKSETSNRYIPISDNLISIISLIPRESQYVFSGKSPDEPIKPHSYADKFERFMEKASRELNIPKLTPHELRHTYGTLLREKGVDIYTIQKVMGHSDVSVTADVYVHNDINVLRKQLKIDDGET